MATIEFGIEKQKKSYIAKIGDLFFCEPKIGSPAGIDSKWGIYVDEKVVFLDNGTTGIARRHPLQIGSPIGIYREVTKIIPSEQAHIVIKHLCKED